MYKHLDTIRRMNEFSSARFVIMPESNLGFEASHIVRYLENSSFNIISMLEDDDRPGIKNDNDTKRQMAKGLALMIHADQVVYYTSFFTTSPGFSNQTLKEEIYFQLANFCVIVRPSENNIYKPPVVIYSGKNGHGFDDLVIALQLNVCLSRFFFCSKTYRQYIK